MTEMNQHFSEEKIQMTNKKVKSPIYKGVRFQRIIHKPTK